MTGTSAMRPAWLAGPPWTTFTVMLWVTYPPAETVTVCGPIATLFSMKLPSGLLYTGVFEPVALTSAPPMGDFVFASITRPTMEL